VGPSLVCTESCSNQPCSYRLGARRCLLKGCEQSFHPSDWRSRYCSSACRSQACRWRRAEANRRYRHSEHGQACRRAQSARYRERARERLKMVADASPRSAEGYPQPMAEGSTGCHRPGCYERFTPTGRSPGQIFCSTGCRQALRRVLLRERRWRRRLGLPEPARQPSPDDSSRTRFSSDAYWCR
jgi:hypothetical protein